MSKKTEYKLTPEQIKAIETVVNGGERAEVVQTSGGLRVLKVIRREVKLER